MPGEEIMPPSKTDIIHHAVRTGTRAHDTSTGETERNMTDSGIDQCYTAIPLRQHNHVRQIDLRHAEYHQS